MGSGKGRARRAKAGAQGLTPRARQRQIAREDRQIKAHLELGNTALVVEARYWIEDCGGDTEDRTDYEILAEVERTFEGGLSGFLAADPSLTATR